MRSAGAGLLAADATLIAPFLALLAAFATYAQSVRFSPENGVAVLPGIAAAWLALRPREGLRLPRAAIAAAAALVAIAFLPLLRTYAAMPAEALSAGKVNEAPEQVPKLDHIPVRNAEWPSMAGIHALWHQRGLSGKPVLATNKRNDLTFANGAYLPWFLDAPPAAWITTYDPGLADRDSVQRDAAAQLCRNRAPVVEEDQDPVIASNGAFAFDDHLSRHLDEFIALNYGSDAVVGFYRLRLRNTAQCVQPDDVDEAAIRARRETALRRDDIPQAAALSVLLVERAEATGRPAASDDVAGALLGGYWVPDAQLPQGPERAGLLALRSRSVVPGEAHAGPRAGRSAHQARHHNGVRHLPAARRAAGRGEAGRGGAPGRGPHERTLACHRAQPLRAAPNRCQARRGRRPARRLGRGARAAPLPVREPRRHPRRTPSRAASGSPACRPHARRPGQHPGGGRRRFDAGHQSGCAARARALGDSVPGVHAAGPENLQAPCATELPRPALHPDRP